MKGKKLKISLSLIAGLTMVLLLGTGCTGILSADPLDLDEDGNHPFLEKLAERFNLDIDEVMDFVDELREEKKTEMEAKFEERLDELVEDGKITSAQKEAILDKKQEMATFREDLEGMTVAEAREALKNIKQELKDWAEDNGLELKYLFPGAAGKMGPGGFLRPGPGFGGRR